MVLYPFYRINRNTIMYFYFFIDNSYMYYSLLVSSLKIVFTSSPYVDPFLGLKDATPAIYFSIVEDKLLTHQLQVSLFFNCSQFFKNISMIPLRF